MKWFRRQRIQCRRLDAFRDSFFGLAEAGEIPSVSRMRHGEISVQLDGSPKLLLRTKPIVFVPEKDTPQGFMGLSQVIVQFQRLQCRGFGLWLRVARRGKDIVLY